MTAVMYLSLSCLLAQGLTKIRQFFKINKSVKRLITDAKRTKNRTKYEVGKG
jgi:hypothetical protein